MYYVSASERRSPILLTPVYLYLTQYGDNNISPASQRTSRDGQRSAQAAKQVHPLRNCWQALSKAAIKFLSSPHIMCILSVSLDALRTTQGIFALPNLLLASKRWQPENP
mmetsp:Transcript_36716/g.71195  ORF Transcript_36716/g.71195 Transcript_36716/m.71195 type:complete len:110 (+) Transcript_36716:122-451(+)